MQYNKAETIIKSMNLLNTIFISIALAMDCFTVSVSGGASIKNNRLGDSVMVGLYFGAFQMFMTLLGWQGGVLLASVINAYDHWIAFILLLFIGGKMLAESFKEPEEKKFQLNHRILAILAIATSIDALGVGFSYGFMAESIITASIIIGITSFLLSFMGMQLGKILKKIMNGKAELLGGIILIIIGLKLLIEHLW